MREATKPPECAGVVRATGGTHIRCERGTQCCKDRNLGVARRRLRQSTDQIHNFRGSINFNLGQTITAKFRRQDIGPRLRPRTVLYGLLPVYARQHTRAREEIAVHGTSPRTTLCAIFCDRYGCQCFGSTQFVERPLPPLILLCDHAARVGLGDLGS